MHLWQVKSNMRLFFIFKADDPAGDTIIIQKRKLIPANLYTLSDAGHLVKLIVIAQPVLMNDPIYQFAAFATKGLIIKRYSCGDTFLAAVAA